MQTSKQARNEAVRALRKILWEVYPVLLFYALYVGVVGLYNALQPFAPIPADEANWILLVTSPFSFIEAVGKTPTQTTQGLLNNFFFPAAMMVMAMLYNTFLSNRLKRYISVPSVFGAGVIGSYLVAGVVWKLTPQPDTGTSIIGFTFTVTLAAAAFADLFEYRKHAGPERPSAKVAVRIVAMMLFGVFAAVMTFNAYLWMNPSYYLHLAGGGAAIIFLYLWSEMDAPSIRKLPRALSSEASRGILFLLIVALVALLV